MRKFLVALSFGLAASAPAVAQQQVVLGFTTAKSGPWVTVTRRNEIAVNIAVEEINKSGGINGKKLVIKQFDTAGKPDQAAVAARQFGDSDAIGIIGPFSSSECRVAFPVGDRLGITQIAIASSAPGLAAPFKFAFRNTSDESYVFERVMAVLQEKKIATTSAAIAYATDEVVAKSLGEGVFPQVLKAHNVPITQSVTFPVAAFDLSAQVSQLKSKPVDIVAVGAPPEAMVVLVKEMRRQGITSRVLGGTPAMDLNLPARAGSDANGTIISSTFYPDEDRPKVKAFRDEFMKRAKAAGETGDLRPNMYDASAYTAVQLYAEAMKRAKTSGDGAKRAEERIAVRDQLKQIRDLETVEGKLSRFTDGGDALKRAYVLEIKDGNWVLLGSRGSEPVTR
jgi:branched-chain amino acid transport system substrate-binding protein